MKKRTINELRQTKEYGYKQPLPKESSDERVFDNQGKTELQMRSSYIGAFVGFVGMFLMLLIYLFTKIF